MRLTAATWSLLALAFLPASAFAEPLRLFTSPAFGQALASITPAIREAGVDVQVKGESSSNSAVQLLVAGEADAVFMVRPLSGEDRALAPERQLSETRIAMQAVAVLVSRDVWEAGVRSISKEQLRRVYERETIQWKNLGGGERDIKFFNFQQGHGVWEQFAQWAYGEIRRAPLGKFESVVTGEDARNAIEFSGGSMTIAPPRWADGREVFALALHDEANAPVSPTREHFADRSYPMARPIIIAFSEKPTGARLRLLDFLMSEKCQRLLFKAGFVPAMEAAEK